MTDGRDDQRVGVEALRDDHVTAVPVPMAPTTGGLPTPLMACRLPLRISAMAVTPASNGTKRSLAGIVLARAGLLSRMLVGVGHGALAVGDGEAGQRPLADPPDG